MYKIAIIKYLEEHGFEAFRPKAVLFDMDGVLYDSMPNHAIAWQESMAKFGIHMTTDDAYATEGARGVDTIRLMVLQQLRREIDEAEAQRMYDEKSRIFHSLPEAPIMPGILDLMRQIQAAGIQCGIVTGSGQLPLIQRLRKDFGAFVDIGVHTQGLVHVSELADKYVKDPNTVVSLHQHVKVRVKDVDLRRGRLSLSMKNL